MMANAHHPHTIGGTLSVASSRYTARSDDDDGGAITSTYEMLGRTRALAKCTQASRRWRLCVKVGAAEGSERWVRYTIDVWRMRKGAAHFTYHNSGPEYI